MAAIAAMIAALAAEHGETASTMPDALARDLFARDARHWLAAFVAETHPSDDVAPLGYALVLRGYDAMHARPKAVLLHLYVVPEARRRGVGTALLSAARDQARVWRSAFLEVGVTADNLVAQQFYQARGMAAWPFHGGIRYCVTP
jgi:GNAT superfamily N-acetyltransferase